MRQISVTSKRLRGIPRRLRFEHGCDITQPDDRHPCELWCIGEVP